MLSSIMHVVPATPPLPPGAPPPEPPRARRGGLFRRFTRAGRQAKSPPLQAPAAALTSAQAGKSAPGPTTGSSQAGSGGSGSAHGAADGTGSTFLGSLPPTDSPPLAAAGSPPQHTLVSLSSLTPDPKAGPHGWGMGRAGGHDKQQQLLQQRQQQQQQQREQEQLEQQEQEQRGLGGPESEERQNEGGDSSVPLQQQQQQQQQPPSPADQPNGSTHRQMSIESWTARSGCSPTAFQVGSGGAQGCCSVAVHWWCSTTADPGLCAGSLDATATASYCLQLAHHQSHAQSSCTVPLWRLLPHAPHMRLLSRAPRTWLLSRAPYTRLLSHARNSCHTHLTQLHRPSVEAPAARTSRKCLRPCLIPQRHVLHSLRQKALRPCLIASRHVLHSW